MQPTPDAPRRPARPGRPGLLALAVLLGLAPLPAAAGPWPMEEGHGMVILPLSGYWARIQGTDPQGRPSGFGDFTRLETSPFWEHGVTSRWTVGLSPRLGVTWLDDRQRRVTSGGLAEVALFARYNLYNGNYGAVSLQGALGTPGWASDSASVPVAERNMSYELRAQYGIGFPIRRSVTGFAAVEAGYRYRPGAPADEVRLDATLGIKPWDRWMFMVQSFNTLGMRNGNPTGADYSVTKLQFSVVYDLTERMGIQVGYMREIDGRRVPLGQAVIGSLWYRY